MCDNALSKVDGALTQGNCKKKTDSEKHSTLGHQFIISKRLRDEEAGELRYVVPRAAYLDEVMEDSTARSFADVPRRCSRDWNPSICREICDGKVS